MTQLWWNRLIRGRQPQRATRYSRSRPSVEFLEDRGVPADLNWVGPTGGSWGVPTYWSPAQIPGTGDTVIFNGSTKDTNSTMDLGGGAFYHIAGLRITNTYTKTIVFQSSLYVDVLEMNGGTIDRPQGSTHTLYIWQRTGGTIVSTKFGTSTFSGGTIKVNTEVWGEAGHEALLILAGSFTNTPNLQADLFTSTSSTMRWRDGNMTVGGGKRISVGGIFLADSTGTFGNNVANWTLSLSPAATVQMGKGNFPKIILDNIRGGKVQKIASAIPGGADTFVVDGSMTQDTSGITEVLAGTLSVQGNFTQSSGSTSVNGGTLALTGNYTQSGGDVSVTGFGSAFSVGGTYAQSGGTATVYAMSASLAVTGSATISGGTFNLRAGGLVSASSGLQIQSGGTLNGWGGSLTGNLTNAGTITLIDTLESPWDLMVTGNYTQSGTLNVGLAGSSPSQYSKLIVSGLATLGGILRRPAGLNQPAVRLARARW